MIKFLLFIIIIAQNISSKGWDAVVGTNLYGTWNCIQEAFDQYMRDNGGRIVNIVTPNRTDTARAEVFQIFRTEY